VKIAAIVNANAIADLLISISIPIPISFSISIPIASEDWRVISRRTRIGFRNHPQRFDAIVPCMPAAGSSQIQIRNVGRKFRGSAAEIRLVPNHNTRSAKYSDRGSSGVVISQAADLVALCIALLPSLVSNVLIETNTSAALVFFTSPNLGRSG